MKELIKGILKELFILSIIVLIISLVSHFFKDKFVSSPRSSFDSTILRKLDSMQKQTNVLKSHIDSINLLKKEQLNVYHKTKWKYDTLKITIDTMPPLDATKLLLSKSRQLTSKGIE